MQRTKMECMTQYRINNAILINDGQILVSNTFTQNRANDLIYWSDVLKQKTADINV